ELVQKATQKIRDTWLDLASVTRSRLLGAGLFREDELRLWNEQIEAQFNVAWAIEPIGEPPHEALQRLRRLLASAKRSRMLQHYPGDRRPKCTLSGDWEQMGPQEEPVEFWRKTFPERIQQIRKGDEVRWIASARIEAEGRERLCAVSLTKR